MIVRVGRKCRTRGLAGRWVYFTVFAKGRASTAFSAVAGAVHEIEATLRELGYGELAEDRHNMAHGEIEVLDWEGQETK